MKETSNLQYNTSGKKILSLMMKILMWQLITLDGQTVTKSEDRNSSKKAPFITWKSSLIYQRDPHYKATWHCLEWARPEPFEWWQGQTYEANQLPANLPEGITERKFLNCHLTEVIYINWQIIYCFRHGEKKNVRSCNKCD